MIFAWFIDFHDKNFMPKIVLNTQNEWIWLNVNECHVTKSFLQQFIYWMCSFYFPGKAKICCTKCQKKCSGEVLRVTDKYFHKQCFQCSACKKSLAAGGFFSKDGSFYCTLDYQRLFGTKCAACKQYVEGEVVSTMGNTYHQKCFTCSRCNKPFQSGSKVS